MFKYPNLLLDIVLSLLKIYFFYILVNELNIIIGFIVFYILLNTYYKVTEYLLNATRLTEHDKLFIGTKNKETLTLLCIIELDNFDIDRLSNHLKSKVMKMPKINSRLITFLGNYYWKSNLTENKQEIEINIDNKNKSYTNMNANFKFIDIVTGINDFDDVIEFCNKEVNKRLDITKQSSKTYLLEYSNYKNTKNKKGALVCKVDHSLSDGLGLLSYTLMLADNFSKDLFPKIMINKITAYQKILGYIFGIAKIFIYLPTIIKKFPVFKTKNNLFKNRKDYNEDYSKCQINKPLKFDFSEFKKASKLYKMSINDIIISIISASLKKFNYESEEIGVLVPIGNTCFSSTEEEVNINLTNNASGVLTKLELLKDVKKSNCYIIHKELKFLISMKTISDIISILSESMFSFFPSFIIKKIAIQLANNLDVAISNIPGPQSEIFIGNCKVSKILPFTSPGINKAFVAIVSYINKIYIFPSLYKRYSISNKDLHESITYYYNRLVEETNKSLD